MFHLKYKFFIEDRCNPYDSFRNNFNIISGNVTLGWIVTDFTGI